MKYWVPDLRPATLLPPQTVSEDKLGGLPWGLPPERWPRCADCGEPLTQLAQLHHHPERLNLGREGRVLWVFQCEGPDGCPTWEEGAGANACFLLDPDEMRPGPTPWPHFETEYPPVAPEVRVIGWLEREDGLPESARDAPYEGENYWGYDPELQDKVASGTRLGSVPHWVQSADEAPKGGWRFVCQLADGHEFHGPVPTPDELGATIGRRLPSGEYVHEEPARQRIGAPRGAAVVADRADQRPGVTWWAMGPNFGDAGIGYIFVRTDGTRPEGRFFWQCG